MKQNQKNKRKIGDRFESKVQKSINSGATWFSPLDLGDGKYAIEVKYTDNNQNQAIYPMMRRPMGIFQQNI